MGAERQARVQERQSDAGRRPDVALRRPQGQKVLFVRPALAGVVVGHRGVPEPEARQLRVDVVLLKVRAMPSARAGAFCFPLLEAVGHEL